jgi:polyhydroxybutyrate depolymerase
VHEHGNITIAEYGDGAGGTEVEQVTIKDGNHCWPGGKKNWFLASEPNHEISATDTIWNFFKAHPKIVIGSPSVAAQFPSSKPSAN